MRYRPVALMVAAALVASFVAVGCAESSKTFGTPAGMRARINELCEASRSDIAAGDVEAIRKLADRIESEVSDVYEAAVSTTEDLRTYADAIEAGETAEPPVCDVAVLPLTEGS